MHITTVTLAALLAPKGNPRRVFDPGEITRLAQSIRSDGVLQNLVVQPEGEDKFRVIAGKRRYLALQALKKDGLIEGSYAVPVEIRENLTEYDALRLATVENVQREQMHVMDEAEAFAKLLQTGGSVEEIADKSGLSTQTVKRRVALANLCSHAKKALRAGTLTRSVAEALTLGSHAQQKQLLESFGDEGLPDPEEIRDMLLRQKPSVAMARFPTDRYSGGLTTDLFADEETTYFDDVDQFFSLQKQAVEALADEYRKTAGFVEVFSLYSVPWWHYREATEGDTAGVVINLHPSGEVEIRKALVREAVREEVVTETRETPIAPRRRERPEFPASLLRYLAYHKSIAVQAALLQHPRKAKELAALLLLSGSSLGYGIRLSRHACHDGAPVVGSDGRGYQEVKAVAVTLANRLCPNQATGTNGAGEETATLIVELAWQVTYDGLCQLSDAELDRLLTLLPILCFGQERLEALDGDDSLFNRVAADLKVNMRDWWTPDVGFLTGLRREQLLAVAEGSGATSRFTGFKNWTKTELVQALSRFFTEVRTIAEDEAAQNAGTWLPGVMQFPATTELS